MDRNQLHDNKEKSLKFSRYRLHEMSSLFTQKIATAQPEKLTWLRTGYLLEINQEKNPDT